MDLKVPKTRRDRPEPDVPGNGTYRATVQDIAVPDEDSSDYTLTWQFEAVERDRRFKPGTYQYTLEHVVSTDQLMDVLVDLGLGGKKVRRATVVGRDAMIVVKSYGGRDSAKVLDTEPLPAES